MDDAPAGNKSLLSYWRRVRTLIIGKAKDPLDASVFHRLSLIAFFAWVGLGSDGLSSSCYGPEEAFLALKGHTHLAILVALASAVTIFVISASYSQIIELFPSGGGGYVVASKLLSPTVGMVSGCALLIDYVLTISISIASGMDAIFSFLPAHWLFLKLVCALFGVLVLTVLNLRGTRESVLVLLPIFLIFVLTHVSGIMYVLFSHAPHIGEVARATVTDFKASYYQIGFFGMLFLLLRAYSMGAGTYTGIEAVSNGVSILREPKVHTAKKTMVYMAVSLAFVVVGLMFAYLLYQVEPQNGKTLNAVLFEKMLGTGRTGYFLLLLTLLSEAAILFVAAQTGFLDGPRVIANMAMDRWFPTRFTMLSDRLVTQNGVLLMGAAAAGVMLLTRGSVRFLVVLYSINVFITFALSQLGMVRHWWNERAQSHVTDWKKKLMINGFGLVLTLSILISVVVIKFNEGGWITLLITGALVALVVSIKRHYLRTRKILRRLDQLLVAVASTAEIKSAVPAVARTCDAESKTAILLVNGFNGLGLHTLFGVLRLFKGVFTNFIIVQVGIIDAGAFKGFGEVERLREHVRGEVDKYVHFIEREGYNAEGVPLIGVDVVDEITQAAPGIMKRFPNAIFFGGQLVFPEELFMSRWLHNYTVFAIQRKFYYQGIPVVLLPIRL
jgi:amino acid transporter